MKAKILVPTSALAALLLSGCQHNYQFDTHPINSTAVNPSPGSSADLKMANATGPGGDPSACCVDPNSTEKKSPDGRL
jgi:hypothetical protein